jgi:hypothetical protein
VHTLRYVKLDVPGLLPAPQNMQKGRVEYLGKLDDEFDKKTQDLYALL